jgi:hypothetical protein
MSTRRNAVGMCSTNANVGTFLGQIVRHRHRISDRKTEVNEYLFMYGLGIRHQDLS